MTETKVKVVCRKCGEIRYFAKDDIISVPMDAMRRFNMTMKDVVKEMNEMTVKELSVIQDLD